MADKRCCGEASSSGGAVTTVLANCYATGCYSITTVTDYGVIPVCWRCCLGGSPHQWLSGRRFSWKLSGKRKVDLSCRWFCAKTNSR
jgi:hypothetical protein